MLWPLPGLIRRLLSGQRFPMVAVRKSRLGGSPVGADAGMRVLLST
jgi:hypothetical protein